MSVETLQTLACAKFLLNKFCHVALCVTKNDPLDITRPKPKLQLDIPPVCQILYAKHPLWLFRMCESVVDRIRCELQAWLNNDRCFPEVVTFHVEIETQFRTVVWSSLQLDAVSTALNLAHDKKLPIDYRLVMAVHYGWLEVRFLCQFKASKVIK